MAYLGYIFRVIVIVLIYAAFTYQYQDAVHRDYVVCVKVSVVSDLIGDDGQRVCFIVYFQSRCTIADKQKVVIRSQTMGIEHRV